MKTHEVARKRGRKRQPIKSKTKSIFTTRFLVAKKKKTKPRKNGKQKKRGSGKKKNKKQKPLFLNGLYREFYSSDSE